MMTLVADAQRRLQHSADLTARHAMTGSRNGWFGKLVTRLHARNLDHLAKVDAMMTQWARYHGYLAQSRQAGKLPAGPILTARFSPIGRRCRKGDIDLQAVTEWVFIDVEAPGIDIVDRIAFNIAKLERGSFINSLEIV